MSDVVHDAQHEFWRPPVAQPATAKPGMVEVCEGCATEFMVGALFCHVCGTARVAQSSPPERWTRYLEFHHIKSTLGLSTASLIAFLAGAACLFMAAIAVSVIYSVQTFNDFQAVQFYRIEWLLGAVAAFAAGLLLKKMPDRKAKR
jgi:cytosine/uracil/thiamine/allantoin permease